MNKNPFYGWLTPLIVCLVTIISFLLLMPEDATAVYWINMGWTIGLEALFFAWIHGGESEGSTQTSQFRIMLGTGTIYYIICSVAWMLVRVRYSHLIVLNLYIVGILVLTALWILTVALIGRHDAMYHEQQTALGDNTAEVRALVQELRSMAEVHRTKENGRKWASLIREAESLVPAQVREQRPLILAKAQRLTEEKREN